MHLRVATERLADRFGVPVVDAAADGRLSRDHPQADRAARPPQEAVRRPRPVRRRGGGDQAAAARRRLRVRGQDHRRRGAAQLHSGGGGGRHRRAQARAARLPGGRRRSVALVDGSYHTVDSSDMAFRTAGRIAIVEGLPQCQPVLLEPIHQVEIVCPTDATAKMNAILSGRRGADPRLRHPRGLGRLGHGARADAGSRDRRPHHRGALGHRRRRLVHLQVRPHGGTDRPHRRPDRGGETGGGVTLTARSDF